ncbi:AraC family transcriptional regulator [Salipaludibacillus sp. CF4.18]|uniref:helix-turn-helix domain-containing protein n=1 Tax=Salipaludibacillus sp. CF4.18 TaxID=3373081 RepID=UPI003EE68F54
MVQEVSVSLREQSYYINYSSGYNSSMTTHHMHQDYEIFYLFKGERIYLINGKEYIVRKDHLVFINKNVLHKTLVMNNELYERFVINFRESFISFNEHHLIKQLFEDGPHVIPVSENKKTLIYNIIKSQINEYYKNQKDKDTYIRSLLTQLLVESTRLLEEKHKTITELHQQQNPNKNEITDVIKFIHDHYESAISLNLLSHHFHLNEQYISRLFKKTTGCSLIVYLNAVRVNEAKRLLIESNMKINLIAKKVGYSNNIHLWRVFKKLTGESPNQYRITNLNTLKM